MADEVLNRSQGISDLIAEAGLLLDFADVKTVSDRELLIWVWQARRE